MRKRNRPTTPKPAPLDLVLPILAQCNPAIAQLDRVPTDTRSDQDETEEHARDAAIALACATPATTLAGLAAQVAALAAVVDWREIGDNLDHYSRAHVEASARHVADFLVSATTTLARMGALPPRQLAEYGMSEAGYQRLAAIAGAKV